MTYGPQLGYSENPSFFHCPSRFLFVFPVNWLPFFFEIVVFPGFSLSIPFSTVLAAFFPCASLRKDRSYAPPAPGGTPLFFFLRVSTRFTSNVSSRVTAPPAFSCSKEFPKRVRSFFPCLTSNSPFSSPSSRAPSFFDGTLVGYFFRPALAFLFVGLRDFFQFSLGSGFLPRFGVGPLVVTLVFFF